MDEHDRAESARRVSRVYDRLAGVYDLYTAPMERFGGTQARARLFGRARGRVLEVGAGTGANFGYYPADVDVTALDISPRMTDRAVRRAATLGRRIECEVGDVEAAGLEISEVRRRGIWREIVAHKAAP